MHALERRAVLEQREPRADARDVRVDGDVAQAVREQQHARGCLAPNPGELRQVVARFGELDVRQPVERELAIIGAAAADTVTKLGVTARRPRPLAHRAQDRLDAHGLDLRDAAGADRLLDLGEWRVAHGLPRGEARAQAQECDVAVAVVRRLREDRQDQLGDRVAVRAHQRDAVDVAQAVADAQHTSSRRRLPSRGAALRRRGARLRVGGFGGCARHGCTVPGARAADILAACPT